MCEEVGTPVWLDCDPGHDDAVAILLAVHLPNIDLLGISASPCNAPVAATTLNAARILRLCGAPARTVFDSPLLVHAGAPGPLVRLPRHDSEIHGASGLGGVELLPEPDDAAVQSFIAPANGPGATVSAIARAARQCRDNGADLTLVITGAQTNAALFVASHPELVGEGKGVKEIVFMGGAVGVGNRRPTAEFNILCDPEAAAIVCDAPCRTVMIGLHVTHTAIWHKKLQSFLLDPLGPSDRVVDHPPAAATPLRHCLATLFAYFAAAYKSVFGFSRGPPIHDALCLLYLAEPRTFSGTRYRVEIERSSRWCDGTTVVDLFGDRDAEFAGREDDWGQLGKNVWVAEKLDVSEGWKLLLRAVYEADCVSPINEGKEVPEWKEPSDEIVAA